MPPASQQEDHGRGTAIGSLALLTPHRQDEALSGASHRPRTHSHLAALPPSHGIHCCKYVRSLYQRRGSRRAPAAVRAL